MSKLRTDASTYSLDVEVFIAEVQNHPVIWDLNCQENRYKSKKQAAWEEIARKFIADFDSLPELEKMDVYRKLHSKWRNIRDSYVRQRKRRRGPKRGYMYASHLAFLNNLYNPVTFSSDEDDQENEASEDDHQPKKRFEPNNDSSTWPSDTDEISADNSKRRRNKEIIDLKPYDPSCSFQIEDEDRSFFESMLPAVRAFNLDQKLEFRSEVLRLVTNIRHNVILSKIKVDPPDVESD